MQSSGRTLLSNSSSGGGGIVDPFTRQPHGTILFVHVHYLSTAGYILRGPTASLPPLFAPPLPDHVINSPHHGPMTRQEDITDSCVWDSPMSGVSFFKVSSKLIRRRSWEVIRMFYASCQWTMVILAGLLEGINLLMITTIRTAVPANATRSRQIASRDGPSRPARYSAFSCR